MLPEEEDDEVDEEFGDTWCSCWVGLVDSWCDCGGCCCCGWPMLVTTDSVCGVLLCKLLALVHTSEEVEEEVLESDDEDEARLASTMVYSGKRTGIK